MMANHWHSCPPSVRRPYLIDGYISATFGFQSAERYMAMVFKVDPQTVVAALENGAFYVFNYPSRYTSPTHLVNGKNAWLLDYSVSRRDIGPVVPQQLWHPEKNKYKNLVDNAQFHVPVFFVNRNGVLGVPISNAGHIQLRDGHLEQTLSHKTGLTIRLAWPGYSPTDRGIKLRGQTLQMNSITLNRLVTLVADHLVQYLSECGKVPAQPFDWKVGRGAITPDKVVLIGLVQVSEGSWMPILQLRENSLQTDSLNAF